MMGFFAAAAISICSNEDTLLHVARQNVRTSNPVRSRPTLAVWGDAQSLHLIIVGLSSAASPHEDECRSSHRSSHAGPRTSRRNRVCLCRDRRRFRSQAGHKASLACAHQHRVAILRELATFDVCVGVDEHIGPSLRPGHRAMEDEFRCPMARSTSVSLRSERLPGISPVPAVLHQGWPPATCRSTRAHGVFGAADSPR